MRGLNIYFFLNSKKIITELSSKTHIFWNILFTKAVLKESLENWRLLS